jgi:SAM-dependent methyltransferase
LGFILAHFMINQLKTCLSSIENSLKEASFVKISLGNYKGNEPNLKNIYIKRVLIKQEQKLCFTYRYQTKDITKNYSFAEAIALIESLVAENGFRMLNLFTTQIDETLEFLNGKWHFKQKPASIKTQVDLGHDKAKNRKIEAKGKAYLQELKITDVEGNVFKHAQDKYKQINHYVEILSSLLAELPDRTSTNVVDMGAGKGYLTFALYDYLNNVIQKPANVVGVEFRPDLVELCNKIAENSDFKNLTFVEGTIDKYENDNINVLIALHACDTATDDAIQKGIVAGADLIVVAPCCHKQIRREIEKNKAKNELDFLTKYGIFLERQAEMVTDGIRALILEYFGYTTKVFEFISDAHTPKNVLIVGIKKENTKADKAAILKKIQESKTYFGIGYHHLERAMDL